MSTEVRTPETQAKPSAVEQIDRAIAALHMLRGVFAAAPMDEWNFTGSPLGTLLQLFPRDFSDDADNRESARELALVIGTDWQRDERGNWEGSLKVNPSFRILLHRAEPAVRKLSPLDL